MKVGCCSWFVFLFGCILLVDCAIEQCTQDRSAVVCRGRCAAAAASNNFTIQECLTKCCDGVSQDAEYPPGCPLLQLNCSTPITPHSPPRVAWREGKAVLLYDDSHLDGDGRNACDPVNPIGNTLPVVVSADNAAFWLIIPGQENLLDLLYSGCHNISVTSVNECGMSTFSSPAQVHQPPALSLDASRESAVEAYPDGRSFPNITVSWSLSESDYVENITVNVTMTKRPSSRQTGCVTASKVYQAQRHPFEQSMEFTPEDFQGNSVWLCHYDIKISVNYRDACTLAEGSDSDTLEAQQITLSDNVGVSASGELVWNQTDATYTFKAKWTVPRTYNLPETITSFLFCRVSAPHFFFCDRNFNQIVPATGNSSYEVYMYGLPATEDGLAFQVQFQNPVRFGQRITKLGPYNALGEPPSQVEFTSAPKLDGNEVIVAWKAPGIPNGVIQSYQVQVKLLNKEGHAVFAQIYTIMGNITSFSFNLSAVSIEKLSVSQQVAFRVSAQNSFLISNFSDASCVTLNNTSALSLVAGKESAVEAYPDGRSFPNITVSWTLSESDYVENITVTVTMTKRPSSRQTGCVTASKVYQAQRHPFEQSMEFTPEDFQGNSVWLCHYDIKISVNYRDACTLAEGSDSDTLEAQQITLSDNVGVSASGELVWNQTDATYTFKAKWTVPRTYNLPETITSFLFCRVSAPHFFFCDRNFNQIVPATGNSSYEVYMYGLPATEDGLAFQVQFRHPVRFGQRIAKMGPYDALGEPPSQVEFTSAPKLDGNEVIVAWKAPGIPNGIIQSYQVQVKLLNKEGHAVFAKIYPIMGNITSFSFNLSAVSIEKLSVSQQVAFRVSAQNSFLISNFSDASYVTLNNTSEPPTKELLTAAPVIDHRIVLPAVIVPVLALLLFILVIVVVISFVMWKLHRNNIKLAAAIELPSMEPSLYNYASYVSKLPPIVVDRWMIPLDIFNSQSFRLIGEGNFSSVYLCTVRGPLTTPTKLEQYKTYSDQSVAVKLLLGTSGNREVESFLNEANVMKHLSAQKCEYIVQLVGVQVEQAPAMIAMELAPGGNLLDILKSSWMMDEEEDCVFSNVDEDNKSLEGRKPSRKTSLTDFQKMRLGHINSYVQLAVSGFGKEGSLTLNDSCTVYLKPSQLLRFAVQVARGMEYLVSCGVVHRDLACRNLLLAADDLVKISDFGFACTLDGKEYIVEDLPAESKPLRWMSPEAFEQNVYSEASDIWSFGVTLWEMFSRGLFPYPALSDTEVLAAVKGGVGFELQCPNQCNQQVYNLMLECWKVPPNERPQFATMRQSLEDVLCNMYPYIEVEPALQQSP